jgi:hypothetical protein
MNKLFWCFLLKHSWEATSAVYTHDEDRVKHTCKRCGCEVERVRTQLPSRPKLKKVFGGS